MKVLLTAEQLRRRVPGGIGTYVKGLVTGLEKLASVDQTLWASRAFSKPDVVEALGLPVHHELLPSRLLTRAWDRGFIKPPAQFDVVHATSTAMPPRSHVPMTAMVHDLAWRSFPDAFPERGRRWHEAALGRAIERSRKLFVPSLLTADHLVRGGVDAGDVVVITEGCDHLPPPNHVGADALLSDAGITGPFLLTVGTLEPRKNLARLARSYALAGARLPEPWPLVVVGPQGWGDNFKAPEGVVAVGAASSAVIAALYERCRLFVSVPLLEGYGLPVIEAMSMGAPVVASPVPSAGDAALEVDPTNEASIADGIVQVATDDSLRNELVVKGRAHAARSTWEASAQAHVEVWETL